MTLIAFQEVNAEAILPKLSPTAEDNESTRISKEAAAEVLITQTEEKALETLEAILKKSKGKPNEPDLWLRRAELYMRRAKSARFFEFQREDVEKAATFVPEVIRDQKSREHLVESNKSYLNVFRDFKSHPKADQALYTFAFNLEQLGESDKSIIYYSQLINEYPKSNLVPDSYLALGEIYFSKSQFEKAIENFNKVTAYEAAKPYWYAQYKKGWAYYNMKNNDRAIEQLLLVIQHAPNESNRISLRDEALKDSTLFFSESKEAKEAYSFYDRLIQNKNELITILIRLTDLYNRHSRFEDSDIVYREILKNHKQPELQAKVLIKQSNMFLTDKAFLKASQSLGLATDACQKINNQSSECEIDLPEIQTKLIRNMWASYKKTPHDLESKKELEKQIRSALNTSHTDETKQKFSNLLGDFLFDEGRYQEAGEQYFEAYSIKSSESALLAAIDSMTKASEKDKKARLKLVFYIDTFTKAFTTAQKTTELRIKKIAIYLNEKEPSLAKPELDTLLAQKDLSNQDKILVEDLYFDYLNQVKDYGTLLKEAKNVVKHSTDQKRQLVLTKMIDEVALKIAQDSISSSQTISQKKDVISSLGEIAISSKTLDPKNKRSAHLLAIKEAYNNKLYLLALNFSKAFIEQYPTDPEVQDIKKNSLKLALDLGDLRSALRLSQELLITSKEKEKSNLIKLILELQQAIGNENDLRTFAEKNLDQLNEKDRAALFNYFWTSANEVKETEFLNWTEQKIKQFNIEPLASEIQLFQIESLLNKKNYEDAFSKSRKYMSTQYSKEIRARARLIQARIFEKELLDIGSKARMERLQLVIGIKTERLDKAQKAYTEVIEMSEESNPVYLEAHLGLERTLGEYIRYLSELEIKNSNPSEAQKIKEALKEIGNPLKKKLETVQARVTQLRQTQKLPQTNQLQSVSKFEFLSEQVSVEPTIDESIITLFPLLVFNNPLNCKISDTPSSVGFKACIASSKSIEQVRSLLEKAQGYEFAKGEIPYLTSFEASFNNRPKEASYLLQLSISQNPDEVAYRYQLGRHLIATGQVNNGLNQLYQVYLNGMSLENLKLVVVIDGYLQNNCYKALAFADTAKSISGANSILSPILSECYAKTGNVKDAIKILDSNSKPQLKHFLQFARVYEDYVENPSLAETFYSKALQATNQNSIKVWLVKKISYLKSQAKSKKADKNDTRGVRQ
jgi:tetratricopeptide (TPR) repeat protein